MSCITEILKLKGEREFMPFPENDSIVIEGGGTYRDYEYLITFTDMGHRCGYVAIDSSHPVYSHNQVIGTDEFDLDVHGGITFHKQEHSVKKLLSHPCNDEWLGFDAAHGNDHACVVTAEKYFGLTKNIEYMKNNTFYTDLAESRGMGIEHRTYAYMEEQCKYLIDQLIRIKNGNHQTGQTT